jgi:hypothetical protein
MTRLLLSAAASISLFTTIATAQWSENFDSYAANSQAVGQGGWDEWTPGVSGAFVSNLQARSPGNSIAINGPTDLVHQYSGATSGKWVYRAWQYIPSTMVGQSYFILLNKYDGVTLTYDWSVQVQFSVAGGVLADVGANVSSHNIVPVITDQWVQIQVVIDLDADWTQVFYNGTLIDSPLVPDHPRLGGGYPWTAGVFGGGTTGALDIAAVDLYANSATDVYYDDMSLTQTGFEVFGTGCSGSMPAPNLSEIMPAVAGQPFIEQIDNLPTNAAVHLFGFSCQNSLLGALPLDLGAYGGPGCNLRVSADSVIFLFGSNNTALFVLNLPVGLQGLQFYVQAAALDPTANSIGLAVSPMAAVWVQ